MKIQTATSLVIVLLMATASLAQQATQYAPPYQYELANHLQANQAPGGAYANVPVSGYGAPALGYEAGADPNCGCAECVSARSGGRYLSLFGGWTGLQDFNTSFEFVDPFQQSQTLGFDIEANNGWCAGGAIGRQLGQRFRTDLEFAYRDNSLESAVFSDQQGPLFGFDTDGKLNTYSGMANLYFDLKNCTNCGLTPYVGGGAGFAFIDANIQPVGFPLAVDVNSSAFAYQLIAGASMPVSQRAQLFAEYRFFGTGDYSVSFATPIGSLITSGDITSHNVVAGLRINVR